MAKASSDVSRAVCANTIQENEKRLHEALDLIKNQVLRHRGGSLICVPFIPFSLPKNFLHPAATSRFSSIYIMPYYSIMWYIIY